jgi:hypothetical protein
VFKTDLLEIDMLKALAAALIAALLVPTTSHAQERVTLGFGRLFSNDGIGDGEDRWRTGSYNVSLLRGQRWSGTAPVQFGELLEYRISAETIAPANLIAPAANDRRYAGVLTLGVHTHFALAGGEARVGAALAVLGPQSGIGSLQKSLHGFLGQPNPKASLDEQLGNRFIPTVSAEYGQDFALGESTRLRPFAEAQAGIETLVRVGGDLTIGMFGDGALMLRDTTTGQRYVGIKSAKGAAVSFTMGADVARVFDSELLPKGGQVEAKDVRTRVRAGLHWKGESSEVFYGVTRLGKEFETQPEAQYLGSLNLSIRF